MDDEVDLDLESFDFDRLVYEAVSQIPRGMVSTYGDVARAMGDVKASREVGITLSRNPRPIVVPCHRVIYGDGSVGWYCGKGKGNEKKQELLQKEGLIIKEGKIADLERKVFRDFRIKPVLRHMAELQDKLAEQVEEQDDFGDLRSLAGLDVAYKGRKAYSAMVVKYLDTGRMEELSNVVEINFPYIPSYLTFRELPALAPMIENVKGRVYLIDGQGQIHPRGFGIASHLGVRFGVPSIGVAKSLLLGEVVGDDILVKGKLIGKTVGRGRKQRYVSVGHRISLPTAWRICQEHCDGGMGDVLLRAHRLAERMKREDVEE